MSQKSSFPHSADSVQYVLTSNITDDPSALLTILRPTLWEAIVRHFIALDAKRILNNFGGAVAVVGAYCVREGWSCVYSSQMTGSLRPQD
jgi:hypothetical protein